MLLRSMVLVGGNTPIHCYVLRSRPARGNLRPRFERWIFLKGQPSLRSEGRFNPWNDLRACGLWNRAAATARSPQRPQPSPELGPFLLGKAKPVGVNRRAQNLGAGLGSNLRRRSNFSG